MGLVFLGEGSLPIEEAGEGWDHLSSAQATGPSSPITPSGNTSQGHQHRPQPWIQTWPSATAPARTSHGPRWQYRPLRSACSSLPPHLQPCFSPQCRNHSTAPSLPLLPHTPVYLVAPTRPGPGVLGMGGAVAVFGSPRPWYACPAMSRAVGQIFILLFIFFPEYTNHPLV